MKLPFPDKPPPGPFRRAFWDSPLRGPWMTAILGSLVLAGVIVVGLTGFLSHLAYQPDLGHNAIVDKTRDLPTFGLGWPTSPSWLFAFTQGVHVNIGLVTIPLVLAKLWSVIPKLFAWPPMRSPAQLVERAAVGLLVSSAIFEFATGVLNAQYFYLFKFNFVQAHYYGAVIFVASIVVHFLVKLPVVARAYRERGVLAPLVDDLAHTRPEPPDPDGLVAEHPAEPTMSRRGLLAFVGAGSLTLFVANVGQSIGGPLRPVAFLAPRRGDLGSGPTDFAVNKTARAAGIAKEMVGGNYRLTLKAGDQELTLDRDALLRMEQRTESLPIACVEGWSTTQSWSGVRISDLAGLVGATGADEVQVESLQKAGVLRRATLNRAQLSDDRALLALRVNGVDLTLDHGFPARIIVPALPGVHNTKWVARMTFA